MMPGGRIGCNNASAHEQDHRLPVACTHMQLADNIVLND